MASAGPVAADADVRDAVGVQRHRWQVNQHAFQGDQRRQRHLPPAFALDDIECNRLLDAHAGGFDAAQRDQVRTRAEHRAEVVRQR